MGTIYSETMLSRWEAELGPFADALGLTRGIFRQPDREYPIEDYYRLLENAGAVLPGIGMRIGSAMRATDLGPLGHAMAAAPTVGRALELLATYLYVFAQDNEVRVDIGQDRAVITYRLTDRFVHLHRQDTDLATCSIARLVRDLSGQRLDPERVELEQAEPGHAAALAAHFRAPVHYEAAFNRLHYKRDVLRAPVVTADPNLCEALGFFLAERLRLRDQDETVSGRVYHLLATSLRSGGITIDRIAGRLGMSRRTLQRHLTDEGLEFGAMLASVRRNVAETYLHRGDYSLTDIALMLGYSELSAFSRAYRRWTGEAPQRVRHAIPRIQGVRSTD